MFVFVCVGSETSTPKWKEKEEYAPELFCLVHWTLLPPSLMGGTDWGVCGAPHTKDLKQPLQFLTNKFQKRKLALTPQGRN